MSRQKDIAQLRRVLVGSFTGAEPSTFYAIVTAVNQAARTCTVEAEEVLYEDVLLYGVTDPGRKGLCLLPAVGSTVLVSRIGGSNELYVEMFSEVDRLLLTLGDKVSLVLDAKGGTLKADSTRLEATEEGLLLTRGRAGLKKTLTDLCEALARMTVSTGVGPSSPPINIADFQKIKQELNDYLKG